MKKVLSILILSVLLITMTTVVNASSADDLADTLYEMGEPYGLRESDKVRIERYLADNDVTDEQADEIISIAEEAIAIFEEAGVDTYSDLTDDQKSELKSLANEAADVLGLTLVFGTKQVKIYQDGTLIEIVTLEDNDILAYTGNSTNNVALVVSSVVAIVAIALVALFVTRKRFANA